eukprot:GHVR01005831.1.p1 GENE.GHVR01005831.1~~GHVR01005831.1.p1  ORF type:complete len:370 (-),score=108.85 GHVR01005831.1:122-1198(-)
MKVISNSLVVVIVFYFCFFGVIGDLPIHCLYDDVIGDWEFSLDSKSDETPVSCGSDLPNTNINNLAISQDYKTYIETNRGGFGSKLKVSLTDDPVAATELPTNIQSLLSHTDPDWKYLAVKDTDSREIIGHWTLTFDEGMEVRVNDKVLFLFFKYKHTNNCTTPKNGDSEDSQGQVLCYSSHCGESMIGWHRDASYTHYGCMYARRVGEDAHTVTHSVVQTSSHVKKVVYNSRFAEIHNANSLRSWTAKQYKRFEDATERELMNLIKRTGWSHQRVDNGSANVGAERENQPSLVEIDPDKHTHTHTHTDKHINTHTQLKETKNHFNENESYLDKQANTANANTNTDTHTHTHTHRRHV